MQALAESLFMLCFTGSVRILCSIFHIIFFVSFSCEYQQNLNLGFSFLFFVLMLNSSWQI